MFCSYFCSLLIFVFFFSGSDAERLRDRFDMPDSVGIEGKQQKKSKNYTKHALYTANRALIEDACIIREST